MFEGLTSVEQPLLPRIKHLRLSIGNIHVLNFDSSDQPLIDPALQLS